MDAVSAGPVAGACAGELAPVERQLLRPAAFLPCSTQPSLPPPSHLAAQTDDEQQWLDEQIDNNAEVAAKAANDKAEKKKQDKVAQEMKDSEPSLEDVPVSLPLPPRRPPLPGARRDTHLLSFRPLCSAARDAVVGGQRRAGA